MTNGDLTVTRIKSAFTEASALLNVESSDLLQRLGVDEAWWLAHDEASASSLVSLLIPAPKTKKGFRVLPVQENFDQGNPSRTDAEGLARIGNTIFIAGSGFLNSKNQMDRRRAFVVRFDESEVITDQRECTIRTEHLDLSTVLLEHINNALAQQSIATLDASPKVQAMLSDIDRAGTRVIQQPTNVEGIAISGTSLLVGLRWPVAASGRPLLAELHDAAKLLTAENWVAEPLGSIPITMHEVDCDSASKNRPSGFRALSVDRSGTVHAIVGSTDRDLAEDDLKRAPFVHLRLDPRLDRGQAIQTFEGFRKVEALAPRRNGDWIYALDDEDAIVILSTTTEQ